MSDSQMAQKVAFLKTTIQQAHSQSEERQQAESTLKDLLSQQPVDLLQCLLMIVAEQQPPEPDQGYIVGRSGAALYFKNAVFAGVFHRNTAPTYQSSAWFQVQQETRLQARDALLSQLGHGEIPRDYMKDLCICIASIGALEVPTSHWTNFITTMSEQAGQNKHMFFKRAAVMILGLLVEWLPHEALSDDDLGNIWNCMLEITKQQQTDQGLICEVATALARLAPASQRHFSMQNARDAMISGLYSLIQGSNNDAAEKALEALIEIGRLNYLNFAAYAEGHLQETERLVQRAKQAHDPTDSLALLSIEVWNFLGEKEAEMTRMGLPHQQTLIGGNQAIWQRLLQLALAGLEETGYETNDDRFDDDQENSVAVRCGLLLSTLAQIVKDDIVLIVYNHVNKMLEQLVKTQNSDWLPHYWCLLAVQGVIEGPEPNHVSRRFQDVVGWLISCSQHQVRRVRAEAAATMGLLAANCPRLFTGEPQRFNDFINWFMQAKSDPEPKVIVRAITGIGNFYRAIAEDHGCKASSLNGVFKESIAAGLQCLDNEAFVVRGLETPIFDALGDIVQHCDYYAMRSVIKDLAEAVLGNLHTQLNHMNNQTGKVAERADFLANNYCGLMQVCVVRLGDGVTQIQEPLMDILGPICSTPGVRVGAILMLGSLQHSLTTNDLIQITQNLVTVVQETLENPGFDTQCKRNATGLIQDLSGSLGEKFAPYIDSVVPMLQAALQSDDIDPSVKTCAIMALGDLCLTTETRFSKHLPKTMELLIGAGKMSLEAIGPDTQSDQVRIVQELRRAIVDAFLSIINGIKSPNEGAPQPQFGTNHQELYFKVFYYLEMLTSTESLDCQDPELAKQILDLYCDVVHFYFEAQDNASPVSNDVRNGQNMIRASDLHNNISNRFSGLGEQLIKEDDGEATQRFETLVKTYIGTTQSAA